MGCDIESAQQLLYWKTMPILCDIICKKNRLDNFKYKKNIFRQKQNFVKCQIEKFLVINKL